jgi:hypothetical protein
MTSGALRGDSYNCNLPIFVYGSLKPNEMAFEQFKVFVERTEFATLPSYEIYVRDLMPLVLPSGIDKSVNGYLLYPKQDTAVEFYEKVKAFEGVNYELVGCVSKNCDNEFITSNVFQGILSEYGRPEPLRTNWSTAQDPLLAYSFPTLVEDIRLSITPNTKSFEDREKDWQLKNRKISNFLLLNSILEHIWSLTYGGLFTGTKGEINNLLKSMANSQSYKDAYRSAATANLIPYVSVSDSRDVSKGPISTTKASGALRTWYRVRGNSLHRGKSGSDTEIVEDSAIGLANLLLFYLEMKVPDIRTQWEKSVPNLKPIRRYFD